MTDWGDTFANHPEALSEASINGSRRPRVDYGDECPPGYDPLDPNAWHPDLSPEQALALHTRALEAQERKGTPFGFDTDGTDDADD
jgi:hypothetical protein